MEPLSPDVLVCVCHNCVPDGERLPRQWAEDGARVQVTEIPCSGKIDAQYMFHALEGGARGLLVVTCAAGSCRLAQGNYRAEVRVETVRRLLAEMGLEPERVELLRCDPEDEFARAVREAVGRICALGESPLRAAGLRSG